jgi:hypothetical protein
MQGNTATFMVCGEHRVLEENREKRREMWKTLLEQKAGFS